MEFSLEIKPCTIKRGGEAVYGRPLRMNLKITTGHQDWRSVRKLEGKQGEQDQSRTSNNKQKPAKAN